MGPLYRGASTVATLSTALDHHGVPNKSVSSNHPSLVSLGQAIRSIRLEQGLSQEMLALVSGVDRSYLGKIERGENNVAILTLIKVCVALDLALEDLVRTAGL